MGRTKIDGPNMRREMDEFDAIMGGSKGLAENLDNISDEDCQKEGEEFLRIIGQGASVPPRRGVLERKQVAESKPSVSFDQSAAEDFFSHFDDSHELQQYIHTSTGLLGKAHHVIDQLKALNKEAAREDFPDYFSDSLESLAYEAQVIGQWIEAAKKFDKTGRLG